MAKKAEPMRCDCGTDAVLVDGATIYPHRTDLSDKWFWRCPSCGGYVGCHGKTKRALGFPAGPALRDARMKLHDRMIDPLWKTAVEAIGYHPEDRKALAIITNTARSRVYLYLAWKLGIERDECHTAMFDLDTCRRAWRSLQGVTYAEIRTWAKDRKKAGEQRERAKLKDMAVDVRSRTEQVMLLDMVDRFVTAVERIATAQERTATEGDNPNG